MTDIGHAPPRPSWQGLIDRLHQWRLDKIASPAFQRWAAAFRLTRPFVRRDAARLHDIMAGFVYSQTLLACTELGVLEALRHQSLPARALAARAGLPEARMETLCQAAAAIGLLVRRRDRTYRLGRLGAAALGVPGLAEMIRHHRVFYRDLSDPVALLKGESDPELSRFWAYVQGAGAAGDRAIAAEYSHVMATSQDLVAQETLNAIDLGGIRALTDVGGGTGTFLQHVAARYPNLDLRLFDLPAVIDAARDRLGPGSRIALTGGSFLDDPFPEGSDAISLVRVLYDHRDETVHQLLARVHAALPPGGRVIVSEPMSGGDRPCRAGDAYFGFYTMAMTTGRARSAATHTGLLAEAGFTDIRQHRTNQPLLTSVISARKSEV